MTELVTTDKQAMSALKQHGNKIVWAIILVLAGYFGWEYYQKHYAKVDTVAADSYTGIAERDDALSLRLLEPNSEDAVQAQLAKERDEIFADIDKLVASHGDTSYAWLALMKKARHQMDAGESKQAIVTLKQAQGIKLDDGLSAIADLRMGQALLADGDLDGALAIAQSKLPDAFEPSRQELLGDIYIAKNDLDNAQRAYQAAWDVLSTRQENRSLLSLKMQALGLTPESVSRPSAVMEPTPTNDGATAITNDVAKP